MGFEHELEDSKYQIANKPFAVIEEKLGFIVAASLLDAV